MAANIRVHDWANSPLGSIESWPAHLRNATEIMLECRFPSAIACGDALITLHNDAYTPILGNKTDALGRDFLKVWEEAADVLRPQADRVMAGEACFFKKACFILHRGSEPAPAWFNYCFSPLRDDTGCVSGMIITAIEVTDEVIAQQALDDSQARLANESHEARLLSQLHASAGKLLAADDERDAFAELLNAVMHVQNAPMGNVQVVNEATQTLDIVAHHGFDPMLLAPYMSLDASDQETVCGRAFAGGQRLVIEDVMTDPGYAPHRGLAVAAGFRGVQSTPIICRDGKMIGIVSTHFPQPHQPSEKEFRLTDLHTRYAAEVITHFRALQALRHSEERYRAIVETQSEMICRFRPDGTILFVNPAYARAHRTTPEELIHANFWHFIPEEEHAPIRHMLNSLSPESPEVTIENRLELPGGVRWTLWTNHALAFDDEGNATEIQSSGFDITERKMAEEHIHNLNATLEQRVLDRTAELKERATQLQQLALQLSDTEDRERQHIALILHDDVQQYLAAIRFHLHMLVPKDAPDNILRQRALLMHLIDESIQKCRNLSHDLSPPVLQQNGFLAAIEWIADDMQVKHGLRVELDISPDAEPPSAALASLLFRSVRELLFNCVKHAETDHAWITAHEKHGFIEISVTDNGVGCDVDAVMKRRNRQSGFGLFNINERITVLGGRVEMQGEPGEGCRVRIAIPRGSRAQLETPPPPESQQRLQDEPPQPTARHAVSHMRVLIADDHAVMRDGLDNLLSWEPGIEIIGHASNGQEAVLLAGERNPDVILMDISMPIMDGIAATAEIRRQLPHIRIIGLSMHEDAITRDRMMEAGATAYLHKAAPSEELLQTMRNLASAPGRTS